MIPNLPEILTSFEVMRKQQQHLLLLQQQQQQNQHLKQQGSTCSAAELTDKETNTECVFVQPSGRRIAGQQMTLDGAVVKRSQTFSPSAPIRKNYICRVSSKLISHFLTNKVDLKMLF